MAVDQSARVMIVEDDPTVLGVVGDYLRAAGYHVAQFDDGVTALKALRGGPPDVLVLDRMLPGISGDELCREARAISSQLPIIMLTALGAAEDRIEGLEHGADDYVAKPFVLRELLLRITAAVRRIEGSRAPSAPFEVGPFRVDPARRRVWHGGREIGLTTREYELFLFLLQNPERILTREEILREVWGWTVGEASTVTVHVRRLREKIEPEPQFPSFLRTEWGVGYRFTTKRDPRC